MISANVMRYVVYFAGRTYMEKRTRVVADNSSSSYMALQPILGHGLLFMRFRNLTLIDSW
jgi:hypothetical protein